MTGLESATAQLTAYAEQHPGSVGPEIQELWRNWLSHAREVSEKNTAKHGFREPEHERERSRLAEKHLGGEGIEIGALMNPLPVPEGLRVRYVDKLNEDDLSLHYFEQSQFEFVPIDIVDDGETLATFADDSVDFIIANHFLEHCQDPIGTVKSHLRVLRPGGALYYAVPDKRHTFDLPRDVTPFDHLLRDHEEGPQVSRVEHYKEWSIHVNERTGVEHEAWWRFLDALDFSIHFHVWTARDATEMFLRMQTELGLAFEIQEMMAHQNECVFILRT